MQCLFSSFFSFFPVSWLHFRSDLSIYLFWHSEAACAARRTLRTTRCRRSPGQDQEGSSKIKRAVCSAENRRYRVPFRQEPFPPPPFSLTFVRHFWGRRRCYPFGSFHRINFAGLWGKNERAKAKQWRRGTRKLREIGEV